MEISKEDMITDIRLAMLSGLNLNLKFPAYSYHWLLIDIQVKEDGRIIGVATYKHSGRSFDIDDTLLSFLHNMVIANIR